MHELEKKNVRFLCNLIYQSDYFYIFIKRNLKTFNSNKGKRMN